MHNPKSDVDILPHKIIGQGPAVALLLPQSTGPVGLQGLITRLAKDYSIITFDQGAHEKNAKLQDYGSIETQADRVLKTFDHLSLDQCAVICHSTGCGLGISLAARYPERVSKLVLTSPWTHGDSHLCVIQNLRKKAAIALDPEQYSRFNAALLFPAEYRRQHADGFTSLAVRAMDNPHNPEVIRQRLDAILAFDARPWLSKITCHTLIIGAKDDQLMPRWFAEEIANGITNTNYIEFETGGHMVPETCLPGFEAAINEHLAFR